MSDYTTDDLKRQIKELEARIAELARDLNGMSQTYVRADQIGDLWRHEAGLYNERTDATINTAVAKVFHTPLVTAMAQMELDGHIKAFEDGPSLETAATMFDAALQMHVEQMIADEAFHIIVKRIARFAPNGGDEK